MIRNTYKGYTYEPTIEVEYDNEKIFHDVVTPEGKTTFIDWSPYAQVPEYIFRLWVDLGCPKRVGTGPLTLKELKGMVK